MDRLKHVKCVKFNTNFVTVHLSSTRISYQFYRCRDSSSVQFHVQTNDKIIAARRKSEEA